MDFDLEALLGKIFKIFRFLLYFEMLLIFLSFGIYINSLVGNIMVLPTLYGINHRLPNVTYKS